MRSNNHRKYSLKPSCNPTNDGGAIRVALHGNLAEEVGHRVNIVEGFAPARCSEHSIERSLLVSVHFRLADGELPSYTTQRKQVPDVDRTSLGHQLKCFPLNLHPVWIKKEHGAGRSPVCLAAELPEMLVRVALQDGYACPRPRIDNLAQLLAATSTLLDEVQLVKSKDAQGNLR